MICSPIYTPTYIKMDIEGAETGALEGARATHRVRARPILADFRRAQAR